LWRANSGRDFPKKKAPETGFNQGKAAAIPEVRQATLAALRYLSK
jgi:hypothetical protein